MPNDGNANYGDIKKSLEVIFERLDALESRANDLELNNGSISNVLKKIESGFSNWKTQQDRVKEGLQSSIADVADGLKINAEGDKAQTSQISSLEANFTKITRQIEELRLRLDGNYDKTWPLEQIRSTVMNSALTASVFRWLFGALGVSGLSGLIAVLFGFGTVDEQEFTYLETFIQHEDRYESFEKKVETELARLNVVYENLTITVEPPSP